MSYENKKIKKIRKQQEIKRLKGKKYFLTKKNYALLKSQVYKCT